MAAHKRYEAVRDEAAAELVKTLRGSPELAALAEFEALSGPNAIYVRWASPGDRAETRLFFSQPDSKQPSRSWLRITAGSSRSTLRLRTP